MIGFVHPPFRSFPSSSFSQEVISVHRKLKLLVKHYCPATESWSVVAGHSLRFDSEIWSFSSDRRELFASS